MTSKILSGIHKYQIPVVGFVNESLLYVPRETDARIAVLEAWSDAGVELGNHTFSHLGFKDASLTDYQDDFIRGETVAKMFMKQKGQKVRYFRHPFLQMGPTRETPSTNIRMNTGLLLIGCRFGLSAKGGNFRPRCRRSLFRNYMRIAKKA